MFVLSPASPFVDLATKIPAFTLNYWRACLVNALDAVGGGTYNIQPGQVINFPAGGGRWQMDAGFTLSDGNVPSGGNLDIDSGGTFTINAGGEEIVQGTNPFALGLVEFKAYGAAQFDSNAFCLFLAGSQATMAGTFSVGGTSGARTLNVGITASGPGHLVVDASGSAAGSDIKVQGGGDLTVTGSGSTLHVLSGADAFVDGSGSTFTVQNSGVLTIGSSGSLVIGSTGSATQNGPWTVSGNGATIAWRQTTIALGATVADGTQFDTIKVSAAGYIVGGGGGSTGVVSIDPPANDTQVGIRVRFYVKPGTSTGGGASDTGYLSVHDTGGGTPELGAGYSALDGSGKLKTAISVELQVVATGLHTRAWECIGSNGASLAP